MSVINFSGLASGIDSNALIDATSAATRKARVEPNQTKVTELEETNSAFEELTTKMEALRTSLKNFSALSGGGVSKTGSSSKESVVSATASNAAVNGSYSVTVNALAKNHTLSFDQTYTTSTDPIQSSLTGAEPAANRTVTFTVGTGTNQETVNVEVTNGSFTVSDFVNAFNNASNKAEASLVNIGTTSSPQYKIVITSDYEGIERGQIGTTVGTDLTNLTAYTQSAATDASFSITGIGTITRASNSVADVIPGLTLNLVTTGTANVKVSEDAATTTSKVQEFIDLYNGIVKYISENNQITRDESGKEVKNTFAPLASTRTDDGALTALRSAISSTINSGGSTVRIFSDLGITTERDGTLKFDTTKFQTAVATEPTSVSAVLQSFSETVASTGGTIDIYTRFNGLLDVSINSNKTLISNLNQRIAEAERQISQTEDQMRARFARLESTMGKMQQQQQSLTSALAGLG